MRDGSTSRWTDEGKSRIDPPNRSTVRFKVVPRGLDNGTMASKRDYYEVLGVEREATQQDLKRAFRSLARKYHPDKNDAPDASDRFKEIQEAFAVLSDEQKRAQYDRFGHDGPGMDFGNMGGFNVSFDDIMGGDLGSIFSQFFGGGGGRRRQRRGRDVLVRHQVSLEQVMNGASIEVKIDVLRACTSCQGTGSDSGESHTCATCSGRGEVRVRRQMGPFVTEDVRPCSGCDGVGRTVRDPCTSCGGGGRSTQKDHIDLKIPAGIENGTRLRLRGRGESAPRGAGVDGDLLVEVRVKEHPWFERNGSDLIMSLPVAFPDLLLGTKVSIDHLDGDPIEIRIPEGSTSGDTVEVPKRGLPGRGGHRGDVVVLLKLHVPRKTPRKVRQMLEEHRIALGGHDDVEELVTRIREDAEDRRRS